jgi:hypothetical protein
MGPIRDRSFYFGDYLACFGEILNAQRENLLNLMISLGSYAITLLNIKTNKKL